MPSLTCPAGTFPMIPALVLVLISPIGSMDVNRLETLPWSLSLS